MRFVADEGNNHAVQVEEEHQQVETKLDEGFLVLLIHRSLNMFGDAYLLMNIQLPEDFCCIEQVVLLEDPIFRQRRVLIFLPSARTSCHSMPGEADRE